MYIWSSAFQKRKPLSPHWTPYLRKLYLWLLTSVFYGHGKNNPFIPIKKSFSFIIYQNLSTSQTCLATLLIQLHTIILVHIHYLFPRTLIKICFHPHVVKLVTVVEGDQKAPFSIATTPRCRRGRYSFPWIAPLYPRYVPYIAEC